MKPRQLLAMKRGPLAMTTLQQRISVAVTAVLALFIIVQGLLAYSSLEEQEDELVDSIVVAEAKRLLDQVAAGESTLQSSPQPVRLAPKLLAWLVPTGQTPEAAALPTHLAGLAEGPHRLYLQNDVLHAVVSPTPGGRLVVQYDATENEQFVYQFGIDLIATGALFIVLGWVMSVLLARIVVAPFSRLARQLAQWAPGDEARPIGRSDEEAMLLQAFDVAQRRLDEALASEREFAANVRHEVRTPLTALRTDAELLLLTLSPAPEVKQRLERMIQAVDSIADGVEALHALSSAAPSRTEAVDLNACVDSAWASLQHLTHQGRMQLRNRLDGEAHPVLDRQALMTVLRNLLRNAIEHASPGICEVRRTPTGIEIADDGPGIPERDRGRIFDRHFSSRLADTAGGRVAGNSAASNDGASGSDDGGGEPKNRGLGLAIARQTALQQGWALSVRPGDTGGSVFALDFTSALPQADGPQPVGQP